MDNCVFCGSHDNLNTSFVITLDDGTKVSVSICDEHAEDATVKSAKKAYMERQVQIDALLKQAESLGLKLAPVAGSKLVTLENTAPKEVKQVNTRRIEIEKPEPAQDTAPGEIGLVPTSLIDKKDIPTARVIDNNTGVGGGYGPIDLKSIANSLPKGVLDGQARPAIVEGRAGTPVPFVQLRRDGLGTTSINIVNKETDNTLQNRFKKMAENSQRDNIVDFIHNGYNDTTVTCIMCSGKCTIIRGGMEMLCPHCDGAGFTPTT